MKSIQFMCLTLLIYISSCMGRDMMVGTSYNAQLVWHQKAEYAGIPFMKRVKEMFYSDPSQKIIKGVIARDIDHSESSAIITAGGVGFTYVNLRFKSERGSSLNYEVEIYV
ncbi:hypothetical protein O3G_MSEX010286 [Manduca sexta]|uniref:Uncharacterized protein n=1 Tax=Manduca sexta TaxID=7130 RepID=A0A921ZGT1_MANSE|nr:hypothetical protein O3G_MSEX010286 [Manduca sexta]